MRTALVLEFASAGGLRHALDELARTQGLLVKPEPRELAPGDELSISLSWPGGEASCAGTVIQSLGEHGVAISFEPDSALVFAVSECDPKDEAPAARWDEPGRVGRSTQPPLREQLKDANKAEKIQLALHGSRPERNLILRDRDKSLHQYVIRNAKLGLDEVAAIAKMSTVAPDVLDYIAGKREWFGRPDIAAALVRNPKVAASVAKKLLAYVSATELRQLAKGAGVREAIAQEARRRLFRK